MVKTLKIKHSTFNKRLLREAKQYLPGGVNSPVRSFKAVGGYPVFVREAKGAKIYDELGREFIDYCLSWGVLILGHAHLEATKKLQQAIKQGTSFGTTTRLEIELARVIIEAIASVEQLRLTNSGTEAVMSAIRLARAYTQKNKIIKFSGCYHGHADYLLDCPGIPEDFKKHTLTAPYNNIRKVKELVEQNKEEIAAIIVEPVAANMGVVLPKEGFLEELREVAKKYDIILIFDEVITGFRLCYGGAQKLFGINPDLTCLGKIIGGGLPVGALGGKKEIMRLLAPEGEVYQAGTFSGNPLSVSAGLATLKILAEQNPYPALAKRTRQLCAGISQKAKVHRIKLKINFIGSMFSLFFTDEQVTDYNKALAQDSDLFRKLYQGLLQEGIYFSPSGLETDFLSTAHTDKDIEGTLKAIEKTLPNLKDG